MLSDEQRKFRMTYPGEPVRNPCYPSYPIGMLGDAVNTGSPLKGPLKGWYKGSFRDGSRYLDVWGLPLVGSCHTTCSRHPTLWLQGPEPSIG